MTLVQQKTMNEALAREPQPFPPASRVANVAEAARIKYCASACGWWD
jgi:hypothetical protein